MSERPSTSFAQFLDQSLFIDPEYIRRCHKSRGEHGSASQKTPMAICSRNYMLNKWKYIEILRTCCSLIPGDPKHHDPTVRLKAIVVSLDGKRSDMI